MMEEIVNPNVQITVQIHNLVMVNVISIVITRHVIMIEVIVETKQTNLIVLQDVLINQLEIKFVIIINASMKSVIMTVAIVMINIVLMDVQNDELKTNDVTLHVSMRDVITTLEIVHNVIQGVIKVM